jgi:hypothetical protein
MRIRFLGVMGVFALVLAMLAPALAQNEDPTVEPFPRLTDYEIIVAEQIFQNGRMFYLQPNDRIWVLYYDDDTLTSGTWEVFENTWMDDEPALDASVRTPDGLVQPERGFGKLWRTNDDLRLRLGWALDPEFGFETRYTYMAGEANANGTPGPGTHTLNSYYGGHVFVFDEATMTWTIESENDPVFTPLDAIPDEIVIEATAEPTATDEPETESEASGG